MCLSTNIRHEAHCLCAEALVKCALVPIPNVAGTKLDRKKDKAQFNPKFLAVVIGDHSKIKDSFVVYPHFVVLV